ncbi:hypothetical protein [Spiroplasma endosymbiont of Amphimallon solstitiale]
MYHYFSTKLKEEFINRQAGGCSTIEEFKPSKSQTLAMFSNLCNLQK